MRPYFKDMAVCLSSFEECLREMALCITSGLFHRESRNLVLLLNCFKELLQSKKKDIHLTFVVVTLILILRRVNKSGTGDFVKKSLQNCATALKHTHI